MAKNPKDEGAGQAAGADQKPDAAADPKAGAEYQKTAAEPVAEPKKDDEVAQLKTEERSIASRLLKARVTREQAQVEEQRLVSEARSKSDEILRRVGVPNRRPTTIVEYAAQEKAKGAKLVTCFIPKPFQHRLDDHTVIDVVKGVRKIPAELANHWWFRANDVVADMEEI